MAPKSSKRMSTGEVLVFFVQRHLQTIGIVFGSVFLALWLYPDYPTTDFVSGLNQISTLDSGFKPQPIAVGWNTNVDLIVDGIDVLSKLKTDGKITVKDVKSISSVEEFLGVFSFWFNQSAAAERYVDNQELFNKIIKVAKSLSSKRYSTGGNAALMANQFAKEGHQVVLSGPIGKDLKALLHQNITFPELQVSDDEIHLILEYSKGAEWNGEIATRANRFILTRDLSNSKLTGMEELQQYISTTEPSVQVLVASGFHLLNDQDRKIRKERLQETQAMFQQLNESIRIHVEFASMSDESIIRELSNGVFQQADSLGLNEQELLSLYQVAGGSDQKTKETLAQQIPRPQSVANALSYLLKQYKGMDRIHFHSFSYHMMAEITHQTPRWTRTKESLAHGSVVATLRACNQTTVDELEETQVELLAPLSFPVQTNSGVQEMSVDHVSPVMTWKHETVRFHYAPVVVCREPVQTVGLGDSISAAALSYSIE